MAEEETPQESPPKEPPFVYKSRTSEEIAEIAQGLMANRYFTSGHIPPDQQRGMMPMVFLPIALSTSESLQELVANNISLFYEENSKAGPRSVNGYPIFSSVQMLNREDHQKVYALYQKLQEAQKKVVAEHIDK